MIALANADFAHTLPVVGRQYTVDYETGLGLGRRLVHVDRLDEEDNEELVVATTIDGTPIVFDADQWDNLNPEIFAE